MPGSTRKPEKHVLVYSTLTALKMTDCHPVTSSRKHIFGPERSAARTPNAGLGFLYLGKPGFRRNLRTTWLYVQRSGKTGRESSLYSKCRRQRAASIFIQVRGSLELLQLATAVRLLRMLNM